MQLGALGMRRECGALQVAEELFQAARALARICAGTRPRPHRDLWGPYLRRDSAASAPGITGPHICLGTIRPRWDWLLDICRPARIFAAGRLVQRYATRDSATREHLARTQVGFLHRKWDFCTTSGLSAPQVGFLHHKWDFSGL